VILKKSACAGCVENYSNVISGEQAAEFGELMGDLTTVSSQRDYYRREVSHLLGMISDQRRLLTPSVGRGPNRHLLLYLRRALVDIAINGESNGGSYAADLAKDTIYETSCGNRSWMADDKKMKEVWVVQGKSESGDDYLAVFSTKPTKKQLTELALSWDGEEPDGPGYGGSWVHLEVTKQEVL